MTPEAGWTILVLVTAVPRVSAAAVAPPPVKTQKQKQTTEHASSG